MKVLDGAMKKYPFRVVYVIINMIALFRGQLKGRIHFAGSEIVNGKVAFIGHVYLRVLKLDVSYQLSGFKFKLIADD
jgi:hypothetical protein